MAQEPKPAPSEDVQLMLLVARGDRAAFARLYARFSCPLLNLARNIVRSSSLAEDIRQDVFQEIWKRADEYRAGLGTPFSWIMTITRHKAIDRLRVELRQLRQQADYGATVGEEPSDPGADRCLMAQEFGSAVRSAVDLLTSRERQAIELAFFEGANCGEIAERLHLPLGTVRARVRRALRHLQRPLSTWR